MITGELKSKIDKIWDAMWAGGIANPLNRYKEVVHETVEHDSPKKILTRLAKLEDEIAEGRKELEGLLG